MALSIESFNIDNLIFEDVKKCVTGDVAYQRIPIKYLDGDRKVDLCIATPELMTYGVQENRQKSSDGKMANLDKPVESYSLPLVMAEDRTTLVFEQILDKCKDHLKLKSTQKILNKFNLAPEVMDIFYRKRDEGELVVGAAPTMYPKLFTAYGKRDGGCPPKITTEFYDMDDEIVDPTTLIGVKAKVIVAITVRDIYIGAKPSIQLKVNDAIVVEKLDKRRRLLVAPQKAKVESVMKEKSDSEEEDIEKQQPVTTKIVRRKPTAF